MLRDIITYGRQRILTIYHENEELDVPGRLWREQTKLGRYWLRFEESSGHRPLEFEAEDADAERGMLIYGHPLFPCGSQHFSVLAERLCRAEKPDRLFCNGGESLRLAQEDWAQLCDFVEKYTGMEICKAPFALGDVFLFHYVELLFRRTPEGAVAVKPGGFSRVELRFKRGKTICQSIVWTASDRDKRPFDPREPVESMPEVLFTPEEDWDTFDICAHDGDELYFVAENVCFVQTVNLALQFGGPREVAMRKSGYRARYTASAARETLQIGSPGESLRLAQQAKEARLLAQLRQREKRSHLIQKGDRTTPLRLVNRLLDHIWDEIWLFDPYFMDRKGTATLIDWMRLLCGSPAGKISAIYFEKPEADPEAGDESGHTFSFPELCAYLNGDWALNQLLRRRTEPVRVIGIGAYIHDRFLLCRAGERYAGLTFGTSLNSLGENYSCIHTLEPEAVREYWAVFGELLEKETVKSEVDPCG
jgi:hypothetical protein